MNKQHFNTVHRYLILILCFVFTVTLKSEEKSAYLLDTGGLRDVEELYLVGTLQGLVNRDAPRLFLTNIFASEANHTSANNVYVEYLQKNKGFTFTKLKSLNDAITTFSTLMEADGKTPVIKGLIKYTPTYWDNKENRRVNKYYNYCIAANFAAQENLLPVTDAILKYQTQMLSGREYWYSDTKMHGWASDFANLAHSEKGLAVSKSSPTHTAFASRYVELDLDITPIIEVVVSEISENGVWSLLIESGSIVDTYENRGGTRIPTMTDATSAGTFKVDLAQTGLFNPTRARAKIKICPKTPDTKVTIKSVRFLDKEGNVPKSPLYTPPKDVFANIPIVRDMTQSLPYEDNEDSAHDWAIKNQLPLCHDRSFSTFGPSEWYLTCVDYSIAKKSFFHYEKKLPFQDTYPNIDTILSSLKPPAHVFGWISDSEDYSCLKLGQHGAGYSGMPPENMTFWQWVPLDKPDKPLSPSKVRHVKTLENKAYVNFSWASADAIPITYYLMDGYWGDKNRGSVPMTWGINPLLSKYAPAIAEYFEKTATPNDSFWAAPNGSGYNHPSTMTDELLRIYTDDAKDNIHKIGVTPAMDYWDRGRLAIYEAFSTPSKHPGVELMTLLPTTVRGIKTFWLDNGTPIVPTPREVFSLWQTDGKSTPQTFAKAIIAAATNNPEKEPQFITCNVRFSPTFLKEVVGLLPDHIVPVGMPDFLALAQEAGALVPVPFVNGVGSGDTLKVSLELHNPKGETGNEGKVTWVLPEGWKSSPEEWAHGEVPKGSCLKQVITLTPPDGMVDGSQTITFKDSRFSWQKQMIIKTFPKSLTITDCQNTQGWVATEGATVAMERDMIKITPKTPIFRHEFASGKREKNNGRVTFPLGDVDFSKSPKLILNIVDQDGSPTEIGLVDDEGNYKQCTWNNGEAPGILTIDLKKASGFTDIKKYSLAIDPAKNFGRFTLLRSIKLCYSQSE